MTMNVKAMLLAGLAGVAIGTTGFGVEPVAVFSGNGTLAVKDQTGKTTPATISGVTAERVVYLPFRKDQGVYLAPGTSIALPVAAYSPAEGTLSFWFRPDWSPGDCTSHTLFTLAGGKFSLELRKGYSNVIAPDNCYLLVTGGAASFGAYNLFTANCWRHYAMRWSAVKGKVEVLVDGEVSGGRTGNFKSDLPGTAAAILTLSATACGAFAEVQLFDQALPTADLVRLAGLKTVARFLQEQPPPVGAAPDVPEKPLSYVDPATGKTVEMAIPAEDAASITTPNQSRAYNPANMPNLIPTACTRWAKPLAGGPIRALIVLPTGFYNDASPLREAVELWQRLDLNCEVTNLPDPVVMAKDYDVIVVGHQGFSGILRGWPDLDQKLRDGIVRKVTSGRSGLVMVHAVRTSMPDLFGLKTRLPATDLLRGFPALAMPHAEPVAGDTIYSGGAYQYDPVFELTDKFFLNPAEFADKVVQPYRDGVVRAVLLNYRTSDPISGLTPSSRSNAAVTDVHYDCWQALLARAVLFAANRMPTATIATAEVSGKTWTVTVAGLTQPARLWYRARDAWERPYGQGEVKLAHAGVVTVPGRSLPPRCLVDFILKDSRGNVLDWYSAVVPSAATTKLTGIALDRQAYAKGDAIHGTVTVQADQARTENSTLDVYLADQAGRRLLKQAQSVTLPAGETKVPFTLTIPLSSASLLLRLDAVLTDRTGIIDERSADCPVPAATTEGFYASVSGGSTNSFMHRQMRRYFADRYGVNMELRGSNDTMAVLPAENEHSIEYTCHLGYPTDEKTLAEWMKWDQVEFRADLAKLPPYRPLFYSLGEEHFMLVSGSDNPQVVARFQTYLQEKYGTLEKLNSIWGTRYHAWTEVRMLTPEVVDMLKIAFDVPNFENRRFMESLFTAKHAYLAEKIRKIDPLADVGIHIGWDLWMGRGYDYWQLSRALDAMTCYGGPHNQYVRSFFKHYYGSWYHYAIGSHDDVRWFPWYMLMSGARGIMWYTMTPQIWGATTADFELAGDWAAGGGEFAAAKETGDLLSRTTYLQDQVAIHYSQDSFQAGVTDLTWIHNRFINLCFDAGVPFRFISYDQLGQGEMKKTPYKVLVLPHSISLSAAEVAGIRDYLAGGGVVWADIIPGNYDNYGRKLAASQLEDLFAGMTEVALPGGKTLQKKTVGKGTVILADPGNYSYERNVGNHLPDQELLAAVTDMAGIERVATVTNAADGKPANGVWTAGYRRGGQHYAVVTRDWQIADQSTLKANVQFPVKGHVYEMRSGEYFGLTDTIKTELEPTRGKLFTVLPYRLKGISLTPQKPVIRGADLMLAVKLATRGAIGPDDLHLLRVSVTGPDGKEITALRRLVKILGGGGEIRLPLAYNDLPGAWHINVRDSATGLREKITIDLP